MGATADGTKELIAVDDGFRESELSWKELLLNLKARGLRYDPSLAIGDGALGFWKALEKLFPTTRVQRCTVLKTANVLDKMPTSVQPPAKRILHSISDAPKKEEAHKAIDLFLNTFEAKHSSAVDCLRKNREVLLTFYDFPAKNWYHIRTTNPIESTFATIRLRHRKTENSGSPKASLVMIFKLAQSVSKGWRKLRGHQHIPELIKGVRFIHGVNEQSAENSKHQPPNPLQLIPKSSPEKFSLNTTFGSNSTKMDGYSPSYVTRKTRVRHYRDFDRFFSGDWYPIVPEWTDHHWRVVHFAGGVDFRMVNPRLDTHAQVNRRCMSTLTYA